MVKKPVRAIIGAIESAAARWNEPRFAPRLEAVDAVGKRTGYSRRAVEIAFERLFGSLSAGEIEAVIAGELGSLDALDGFVALAGRPPAQALPIGRVCIVSSRTTIGVAIVPAIFALCAKCDVVVKDREDHLVAAFFETLAREMPELRASAMAQIWHGKTPAGSLENFDAVAVFGSDATLAEVAARLPVRTKFIGYGSKASAGYVTREILDTQTSARATAEAAALDIALYESEGCLSLHALFVERGGAISPEAFAEMLAAALVDAAAAFAPAPRDARAASHLAAARDLASFRASSAYSDANAGYLAVLDPPFDEPPLFLPRAIGIRAVDRADQAAEYLRHHAIAIEGLGVSQLRPDLLDLAITLGAARVTKLGSLQAPPLGVFHGGRPRIAEFVRWIACDV
jgi:hypothetical protein